MVAVVAAEMLLRPDVVSGSGAAPVLVALAFTAYAVAAGLHVAGKRPGVDLIAWCCGAAVCNVAAFGLLRIAAPDLYTGLLVLLPLMYLARLQDLAGAAMAVGSVLGLYLLPNLVAGSERLDEVVMYSVFGIVFAVFTGATSQAWSEDLEALDRQRSLVDSMIQAVDVGLVLLDESGRYEVINPRHRDFIALAYPDAYTGPDGEVPDDVYAADRTTWLPPEQRPSARANRGEEIRGEIVCVGPPGSSRQRALSVSARSFFDEAGQRQGTVMAFHDITEAMQALRAKDDFIAMVSHELRTPLTSIMGYLDLAVTSTGVSDDVRAHLEVVERNATRLHSLVGDLLDVASAADGRVDLHLSSVELHRLVPAHVEGLRHVAARKGLEICTEIDDVPAVQGDARRLGQVVDNLLTNAVKYSGDSTSFTVRVCRHGEVVRLLVVDHGIGMSPDDLDQAFSQFFRSPALNDQTIQGAGLGLAITRSIVERHGGRIVLESEAGVGTTAIVDLPIPPAVQVPLQPIGAATVDAS